MPRHRVWGMERVLVANFRLAVLEACKGNRVAAAHELGISVRALRGFLARLRNQGFLIMPSRTNEFLELSPEDRQAFVAWATLRNPLKRLFD